MSKAKRVVPYRRKREGRTDYKKRLALLLGQQPRFVVRKSGKNLRCQLVEYRPDGDHIVASASTEQLKKYGWVTSRNNIPAAYLCGMLLGKRAVEKKITSAVFDMGLYRSTKGSRLYAALKGAVDAGVSIPHGIEVIPSPERINGSHLAAHAKALSQQKELYQKYYSDYTKAKVDPTAFPRYFEKIKESINHEKA